MQNRTDMVGVSLPDKFKQLLYNNRKWLALLGYALSGYVMANSLLFGGVAPFGVAWCAALPRKNAPGAALGAIAGYLLTLQLASNIKYIAAVVLVLAIQWLLALRPGKTLSATRQVVTAFAAMGVSGLVVSLAADATLYDAILSGAEVLLATGATYFFARTLSALSLGLTSASRSDISCMVISFAIVVMGFEALSIGGLSVGRIVSVLVILLCARYAKEAGGAIAGVTAGIAMGFTSGDYSYVISAYSLGGLIAGVFGHMGRVAAATAFVVMNALTALLLPERVDVYTALFEVFAASVIFIVIPPGWIHRMKINTFVNQTRADASAQTALRGRLDGISEALMEISATTHQVSDELGKLEHTGISTVYNRVIDPVCVHCGMKSTCWQGRYIDSMNAMHSCIRELKKDGSINREKMPKHFTQTCCKLDDFISELNTQFRGHVSREGVQMKVSKVRSVVTDQFEGMALMVDEIADELCGIRLLEPQRVRRVREYFEREGIDSHEVLCYNDEFDRLSVDLVLPSYQLARVNKGKVALDLCSILEADFDLPRVVTRKKLTTISFSEKANFTVETGAYQISCGGNRLCGDAYECVRSQNGKSHFILSDGMGSGGNAAVDSAMAAGLLSKLISIGVSHEAALKMVNSALLIKSGEESLATIDICTLDLYTGRAEFYKAGAAPTFIIRDSRAGYVESTSLPAGILRGVAFEKSALSLREGDLVVMVSDGVIATGCDWVKSELESLRDCDMQRLCEKLAMTAKMRRTDDREDDITVMAAALRKGV